MTGVENIELPQFDIIDYQTQSKKAVFATGNGKKMDFLYYNWYDMLDSA